MDITFTENLQTAAEIFDNENVVSVWCRPDFEVPDLAFNIEFKLENLLQKKYEDDFWKVAEILYWHSISANNKASAQDLSLGVLCDLDYIYFIGSLCVNNEHHLQLLDRFSTKDDMCKVYLFILDYFGTKGGISKTDSEALEQFLINQQQALKE